MILPNRSSQCVCLPGVFFPTLQHMLLEVDTLAADPDLLRVISAMANSIAKLDAKVKELEKKLE